VGAGVGSPTQRITSTSLRKGSAGECPKTGANKKTPSRERGCDTGGGDPFRVFKGSWGGKMKKESGKKVK